MKRFTSPGQGAAVPVRVFRNLTALPASPPPALRRGLPPRDRYPTRHLERDRRFAHYRLTQPPSGSDYPKQPTAIDNLTMPMEDLECRASCAGVASL
jgi:hypothetical protein